MSKFYKRKGLECPIVKGVSFHFGSGSGSNNSPTLEYDAVNGCELLWIKTTSEPTKGTVLEISGSQIRGLEGNDFISGGGGADRIFGGPGDDELRSSSYYRDYEKDIIDCGSGADIVSLFYSGEGDTCVYCEDIINFDG